MSAEQHLQRATLLFQHQRYSEAEKEYGILVTEDPSHGYYHSMLALCALYQDKKKEAERHAKEGIHASPSESFCFYVAALVAMQTGNSREAESFCYSAITLDPYKADYYELKSLLLMNKKEWQRALDAANEGLAIESDHIGCLNCRAKAYIKLNDKQQAYDTISDALYFDPENAHTHANLGWGLLEKHEHKKALEHFKQALSIDPGSEYAKAGMIEALKARYWFYRIFLRYAFWIGNMKSGAQWAVIIGFYVGAQVLRHVGDDRPELEVITVPLTILYSIFALSTWIINPLSNLFLRLNVYGRYALSKEEITCSNLIGVSFLVSILAGTFAFFTGSGSAIMLCILAFSITIPVSGTFAADKGTKGRTVLSVYALLMLLCGILSILIYMAGGGMYNLMTTIYLIGFILYQWIANAIHIHS